MNRSNSLKKLSTLMLITNFVCTVFYALSYPYIYAEAIKVIDKTLISIKQIIECLGVVIFGMVWNKMENKLFKHYRKLCIVEIIADTILFLHVIITGNLQFYFILNFLIFAIITRNMANGGIKLRAKVHPDEKSRERYDNNSNIVNSAATLIGAGTALLCPFSLKVLFIFALIGNTFDNFCYLYIYNKIKNIPKN